MMAASPKEGMPALSEPSSDPYPMMVVSEQSRTAPPAATSALARSRAGSPR